MLKTDGAVGLNHLKVLSNAVSTHCWDTKTAWFETDPVDCHRFTCNERYPYIFEHMIQCVTKVSTSVFDSFALESTQPDFSYKLGKSLRYHLFHVPCVRTVSLHQSVLIHSSIPMEQYYQNFTHSYHYIPVHSNDQIHSARQLVNLETIFNDLDFGTTLNCTSIHHSSTHI